MLAGNVIVFYFGILLIPSIKQIFTMSLCDITKGDCVADDKRKQHYCNSTCFRTPVSCNGYDGVDLFGKNQNYQCNCKHLSDCQFQILSKCKNGCLPGFKEPYCQKRRYHEFIKNESIRYSYLFSSDNKLAVKPRISIRFRNSYRFSTVEIFSNFSDSTMKVIYPVGMECKLKLNTNNTMCTGDVKNQQLFIDGKAGVYRIKLLGCPPQLYGKNCTNKCHCSGVKSCHQITGKCKDRCEDGWYGEKCDSQTYVNIAQGKQTNQSSTYGTKGTRVFVDNGTCVDMKVGMTSAKAVDGNFDPEVVHKSCANTNKEKDPFWQVTFDKSYMISQLRIYNRMRNRDRLKGFKVYAGSSLCFQSIYSEYDKDVIHIKCRKPLNSSYVKISLDGWNKMLTLCEVEVIQCAPGFYGDMCMERCEHCEGSKCDEVTGRCEEGCMIGYYWSVLHHKCKECLSGYFGHNCRKSCHCSRTCNHINGSCPGECDAGYTGYNCQEECKVGRFGSNCNRTCHCMDNINCDRRTGKCSDGCSDGYKGDNCQQKCSNGTFGHNCNGSCHCSLPCNHVSGSCPGDCDAGYTGFNCQKECEGNTFGLNCKGTCHCVDNENCNRQNGTCLGGCAAGYEGDNCQQECSKGSFGQNCIGSCHCSLPCNHVSGSCRGDCDAGYTGFSCQKECEGDRFGVNCNSVCHCVDNKNCSRRNGICLDGCAAGYEGDNCQQEKTTKNILVFILVPLLLFVILAMGIVAAIWCWKKKKIAKRDKRVRKTSENMYSEAIPDDTAHIYEDIQMKESEGVCINKITSLPQSNLQNYVAQKKQEVEPFNDEFLRLPQTVLLPYTEATKPENSKKNLHNSILPYDHSRVKLQPDEISSSDYINANFISNQRYIACQGPTQSTLTDFWRMIWQLKCNTIIALKDTITSGKMMCMQYWPDEEHTESFGTIRVTHINTRSHTTYIHRRFIISKTGLYLQTGACQYENESWTIDQFFFRKWPDHDIPQHAEYILDFKTALKSKNITYPLVVHCSAGVGRTGTYICIDILLNEMLTGESVDVLACVTKLREERMHMVQKRTQLEFIYDVLVENILTKDYDIDVSNIPVEFSRIKETDNSTSVSILEHQFQGVIKQVQLHDMSITLKEDELANFDMNGVFIDGPSCESEFLVTETPREGKAAYFLKCLINKGYLNIVAFLDPSGDPPNYLPRTLNESVKLGQYLLELVSVEDKGICICSTLKVRFHNKKMSRMEEYEINHFLVTIWVDENYPSCGDVLNLSNMLRTRQNEQFNKKIAIHSRDNFYKSGLLCVIHILKDAITSQSVINIVRLVRLIKKIEPNIIPDCESYAYIWEVAEYLQKETLLYTNFMQ